MKLQQATWPEVEAYLETSDAIVIPIGSTEQHGPTGLIGTDAICPETIAGGMAELGVLVGPTLSIGMAQHHLAFPGSIALRPSTLMAVIRDVVGSLSSQGFRRFMFLNGHGGNIATVHAAFDEIWSESSIAGHMSDLQLVLFNWFTGRRARELSAKLFGDAEGSHATPSEISLTWFTYPDRVSAAKLNPRRAPNGGFRDARDFRENFPDGRMGSEPGLASVEHGKRIYRAGVEDAMEAFDRLRQR
ncbi:MAG TPA: creatininase family protein [Wenzhouxiangellaceae bacterium]|nr:creatininase family protein [Wenzhouxiangellaceae bacterium]